MAGYIMTLEVIDYGTCIFKMLIGICMRLF